MKKILIVEDDPDLQHIFKSVLIRAGYDVRILPDGRSLSEQPPPDIFVFDIELPYISGLDLCRKVKGDPALSHTPVLIISASATLLTEAKDACADAALEKPIDGKKLVNQVSELLAAANRR